MAAGKCGRAELFARRGRESDSNGGSRRLWSVAFDSELGDEGDDASRPNNAGAWIKVNLI